MSNYLQELVQGQRPHGTPTNQAGLSLREGLRVGVVTTVTIAEA